MTEVSQPGLLSNAEVADRLSALAQLLAVEKANPYKIRAYQRAAAVIRGLGESVDELVRSNEDLRIYAGIGVAISGAIREIVETGSLKTLEKLRSSVSPELASLTEYPRLDPKRVLRVYKKLKISSIEALRQALENGEIERIFGARMAQHVGLGLVQSETILLYHAHSVADAVSRFLLSKTGAERVQIVGDYRRNVEIISSFNVLVQTADFTAVVETMKRFAGRMPLIEATPTSATYSLPSGPLLCIERGTKQNWGLSMICGTGSAAHLRKLSRVVGSMAAIQKTSTFATEEAFYKRFRMQFIPPELREGLDEVGQARKGAIPKLITQEDIWGLARSHLRKRRE